MWSRSCPQCETGELYTKISMKIVMPDYSSEATREIVEQKAKYECNNCDYTEDQNDIEQNNTD